jgi:hypothetical protein
MLGTGDVDLRAPRIYPASSGYLATTPYPANPYLGVSTQVQYNKSGTDPHGVVTLLFSSMNKPDGSVDTGPQTYQVTTNSIASLAKTDSTYTFTAKSNIIDVGTGLGVDSGATLQVVATTGGPIAVSVQSSKKGGPMWISSAFSVAKPMSSGGITAQ